MSVVRFDDDPWQRLPWTAAPAVVLTLLSLMGFLRVLEQPPGPSSPPPALEVRVLELPPPAPAVPSPPAPRPPPPPKPVTTRPKPTPAPPSPPPPAWTPAPEVNLPEVAAPPTTEAAPASPAAPPATVSPSPPAAAGSSGPTSAATTPPAVSSPVVRGGAGHGPPGGGAMGARAIYKPLPEIPEALRRRSLEMVAVARFTVAANGLTQVELTEPTSEPELNRVLLASLKQWRFFPAMQDGRPVASIVDIRIPISVR